MFNIRQPRTETVEEAAAEWFALARSGAMTDQQTRALNVWLVADPVHRAAYDKLQKLWSLADTVRSDPQVLALRGEAHRAIGRRWAWRRAGQAIAASLALALIAGPLLLDWRGKSPVTETAAADLVRPISSVMRTAAGEVTTAQLSDGTIVTIDTSTVVRADFSGRERRVELDSGRAFFRVAKDATRPFIVRTGDQTVTALGTAFAVRATSGKVEVTLLEGRVRVDKIAGKGDPVRHSTELTAGSRLVTSGAAWTVDRARVPEATSWMKGQLSFDNQPMRIVVAEMNRYSERKIILSDDGVGDTPILGVFAAGDVDGLARALEEFGMVRIVERTPDQITVAAP